MISLDEDKKQLKSDMFSHKEDFKHLGKSRDTLTITMVGDKGTGKTLFMCIIALIYNYYKKSFYTNFTLAESITYQKPFNIRELYNNPNVEAIFLDEVHNIANQHSNQSLETSLLVALFSQSRKRNQLIVMTTLRFYKLAKDLRYLTNIIIYPEINLKRDTLTLEFLDLRDDRVYKKKLYNVSAFFPYYDTYEMIVSEQVKDQLSKFMLKQKELKKKIETKLDENDKELLDNLEERLKE